MRIFSTLFAFLLAAFLVSAIPVDPTDLARDASSGLTPRAGVGDTVQISGIRLWTSRKNGRLQFRLLGGLRIVEQFYDMWTGNEFKLAKAFFSHFMSNNGFIFGQGTEENAMALYKSGQNSGDETHGLIGLQWEWEFNLELGFAYNIIIEDIKRYFLNNQKIALVVEPVSDAFTMGGPLKTSSSKRGLDGKTLDPRDDDDCVAYDFVSWFRPFISYDPNAPLYATDMCDTISAGPTK